MEKDGYCYREECDCRPKRNFTVKGRKHFFKIGFINVIKDTLLWQLLATVIPIFSFQLPQRGETLQKDNWDQGRATKDTPNRLRNRPFRETVIKETPWKSQVSKYNFTKTKHGVDRLGVQGTTTQECATYMTGPFPSPVVRPQGS